MMIRPGAFDLVIAFPPCTDLSLAGARFWKAKQGTAGRTAAAEFFIDMVVLACLSCRRGESSGHHERRRTGRPDQVVEPFWFGDPFAKKTCLWT